MTRKIKWSLAICLAVLLVARIASSAASDHVWCFYELPGLGAEQTGCITRNGQDPDQGCLVAVPPGFAAWGTRGDLCPPGPGSHYCSGQFKDLRTGKMAIVYGPLCTQQHGGDFFTPVPFLTDEQEAKTPPKDDDQGDNVQLARIIRARTAAASKSVQRIQCWYENGHQFVDTTIASKPPLSEGGLLEFTAGNGIGIQVYPTSCLTWQGEKPATLLPNVCKKTPGKEWTEVVPGFYRCRPAKEQVK